MPNTVAFAALLVWPFVTFAIFASLRLERAVIFSLLAGYLLLPVRTSFDFPGVPALDKTSVANLSTFVAAMFYTRGCSMRLPVEPWLIALILTYLIAPMLTVVSNGDALVFGDVILPGLKPYDALSVAAYKAIDLIPFLLGYNLLRTPAAQNEVLRTLVISALAYSLLMLIEIRLSPQLHTWVYGFFPHSFGQQVRGDGFRPVVFLGHGLVVAIYTAIAVTAAGYLTRRKIGLFGIPSWFWLIYLIAILLLCKSLGALLLALGGVIIVIILDRTAIRLVCIMAAFLVLIYPALRGADLIPVQMIADQVAQYNEERGESFQTRIDNEEQLLARANQRPWFGWGGYGRNRVFDGETGKDLSITDGTWIIIVGIYGWIGYLTTFGIICLPIMQRARSQYHNYFTRDAIALVLAVNLLDLIPNSSLGPITWLLAGSVMPAVFHRTSARMSIGYSARFDKSQQPSGGQQGR